MSKLLKTVLIALIFSAVIFTGCKKNKAPDKPSTPAGPASGSKNTQYTFTSSAEDPDEDSVAIRFDWGNGDTSNWSDFVPSSDSISMSHSWSDSGSYTIKAQAEDLKEAVSSWSSGHQIIIGATIVNNPPNTPTTPIGDSIGLTNVSLSFISTATDPNGDSIAIRFNWGDGVTSNWSDFVPSGDSVSMVHTWSDTGTFNIKAQAKDKKDTTSGWSAGHSIKMSGGGWIKTFGGSADDYGYSVQPTSDGGYIIAGNTYSYGQGQTDVYLIKTDSLGDTLWTKTVGGPYADRGYSVQQTLDGGYIITGHTWSYGVGQADVYLIKTNANGDTIWTNDIGGSYSESGNSVQPTTDGGYIITGYTKSYHDFSENVWLVKTDAGGWRTWHKRFSGDTLGSIDCGNSVLQTADGGYIITGSTNAPSISHGDYDVYLIKTDANGDSSWIKTFGGSGDDVGYSIQRTTDGGYIIAGYTKSYSSSSDIYLIKIDANGDSTWVRSFGGPNDDAGMSVQQTVDGGYIIAGYTNSSGAGDYDVYLIKTNAEGDKLWEKTFGGPLEDRGYSIQRIYDSYIITGYTKSFGAGGYDVYLIKTDANGNVK